MKHGAWMCSVQRAAWSVERGAWTSQENERLGLGMDGQMCAVLRWSLERAHLDCCRHTHTAPRQPDSLGSHHLPCQTAGRVV